MAGTDQVINEYIKSTADLFIPVDVKLFNTILDHSIFPDEWFNGTIIPIYKNKGDCSLPELPTHNFALLLF